eukprot:226037_1
MADFRAELEAELASKLPQDADTREEEPSELEEEDEERGFSRVITPFMDIEGRHGHEVFCVRYSQDSQWLAAGCGDGTIRVYNAHGRPVYNLVSSSSQKLPCTAIRWRPQVGRSTAKNILIGANADGTFTHWHVTSQKALSTNEEEDNQIYAMDYRSDGESFVTAGRDYKIRVYDEETKELTQSMSQGISKLTPGHSNRIFAAKFKPDDPNTLITGGWDNTVYIWDLRTGHAIRNIFGPHIAGDALDIFDDMVLTASWRPEKPVEIWDFGTGKMMHTVYYLSAPMMYSAQFHPSGDCIAVGGTGTNESKIFDARNSYKSLGRVRLIREKGVYSLDFSPNGTRMAIAGATDNIRVLMVK